ncbi:DNA -binding domain-containing protein [Azospirillum sp. ST 5-10]|uniref:DNA -binding domain-containing protein n=1 Tax=unclassified Azospirillum TaxID=2630922 RepID=UPI003F49F5DD
MKTPRIDAPVFDEAPSAATLTDYDRLHLVTYLRLLDAAADGADPDEVARLVLRIDPDAEPERARRAHASHLARARWMSENGYRHLLRSA